MNIFAKECHNVMNKNIVYVMVDVSNHYHGLFRTMEEVNNELILLMGDHIKDFFEDEMHKCDTKEDIEIFIDRHRNLCYDKIIPVLIDITKPIYIMYTRKYDYDGITNNINEWNNYSKTVDNNINIENCTVHLLGG
jgi:hypothetical protein